MTTKKKQKTSVKYKIKSLKITRFFENDYENLGLTSDDIKNCKLEYSVGLNINSEEETISFVIGATYYKILKKSNERKDLFGIEAEYVYKCQNFKEKFPPQSDETVDIPDALMTELLQIAIHGTRGMMVAQANNPVYKKMFLPQIDFQALLKNLHETQLDTKTSH